MDYKGYQCVECASFDDCQKNGDTCADDAACMLFKLADYIKDDLANQDTNQNKQYDRRKENADSK